MAVRRKSADIAAFSDTGPRNSAMLPRKPGWILQHIRGVIDDRGRDLNIIRITVRADGHSGVARDEI
jgi:hypothetical protein